MQFPKSVRVVIVSLLIVQEENGFACDYCRHYTHFKLSYFLFFEKVDVQISVFSRSWAVVFHVKYFHEMDNLSVCLVVGCDSDDVFLSAIYPKLFDWTLRNLECVCYSSLPYCLLSWIYDSLQRISKLIRDIQNGKLVQFMYCIEIIEKMFMRRKHVLRLLYCASDFSNYFVLASCF